MLYEGEEGISEGEMKRLSDWMRIGLTCDTIMGPATFTSRVERIVSLLGGASRSYLKKEEVMEERLPNHK